MIQFKYIYKVNYQDYEQALCALEVRALFNRNLKSKAFFSDIKINPNISAFIKSRTKIIYKSSTFNGIIDQIKNDGFASSDFFVNYVDLSRGDPHLKEGKGYAKALGLVIQGLPSFQAPKTTFSISFYEGSWYFGKLFANDSRWRSHINKPKSYSSSIGINIAKVLINAAGNGDLSKKMIDPCCGAGTVVLEGLYAGYDIIGREINDKIANDARSNLIHFDYLPKVTTGDICDISDGFDASIVDLPYGIFSHTNEERQKIIIKNAKRISKKIVLVSAVDIRDQLLDEKLSIIDHCVVRKSRKSDFIRYIWVCLT